MDVRPVAERRIDTDDGLTPNSTTSHSTKDSAGRSSTPTPSPDPRTTEADAPTAAPCRLVDDAGGVTRNGRLIADASAYIQPRVVPDALTVLKSGTAVTIEDISDDWYLVQFADPRWGPRHGYIPCSRVTLRSADSVPAVAASSSARHGTETKPPARSTDPVDQSRDGSNSIKAVPIRPAGPLATWHGYVEWQRRGYFIADGQRVRWDGEANSHTRRYCTGRASLRARPKQWVQVQRSESQVFRGS
jgi:hypothetical protein